MNQYDVLIKETIATLQRIYIIVKAVSSLQYFADVEVNLKNIYLLAFFSNFQRDLEILRIWSSLSNLINIQCKSSSIIFLFWKKKLSVIRIKVYVVLQSK